MAKRSKSKASSKKATRRKVAGTSKVGAAKPKRTVSRRIALRPEFAATAAGCLDQETAADLVYSCTGLKGEVSPGTTLGSLFPSDVERRGFCGCVYTKARKAGSTVRPGDIPCSPSTTIGEVIDSIAC